MPVTCTLYNVHVQGVCITVSLLLKQNYEAVEIKIVSISTFTLLKTNARTEELKTEHCNNALLPKMWLCM